MSDHQLVDDDFVLVNLPSSLTSTPSALTSTLTSQYLDLISDIVDELSPILRPINLSIHDNPELNYKEHHAHDLLVGFLAKRRGWKIQAHAYNIDTAFIAVFDSGKEGPVVSFNVEYGNISILIYILHLT